MKAIKVSLAAAALVASAGFATAGGVGNATTENNVMIPKAVPVSSGPASSAAGGAAPVILAVVAAAGLAYALSSR